MIKLDEISKIVCSCGSCADCSTVEFDKFVDLIEENGEECVNQEREALINGARLLYKVRFPVSAEQIAQFETHIERAAEMAQNRIDFHCLRIQAIVADVPEDTPWLGFVLHGLKYRDVYPEPKPFEPRRRSKPKPPYVWMSSLFEFHEVHPSPPPINWSKNKRNRK